MEERKKIYKWSICKWCDLDLWKEHNFCPNCWRAVDSIEKREEMKIYLKEIRTIRNNKRERTREENSMSVMSIEDVEKEDNRVIELKNKLKWIIEENEIV